MSAANAYEARCPCGETRLVWESGLVSVEATCSKCGERVALVTDGKSVYETRGLARA